MSSNLGVPEVRTVGPPGAIGFEDVVNPDRSELKTDDRPLAGRVAVVSGGGRGLGRSFCLGLGRLGAKVVVNNRNRVVDADGRWGRLDVCVANAASKGGLLAFGRSLAAEGAGKGVLTNMLLPYALTQMTEDGMPPAARGRMEPDLVTPVLFRVSAEAFSDLMDGGAS
jgi:NAD(P)-dependent dehydrogenase (short-subunit alcohol dehydrogenase family)